MMNTTATAPRAIRRVVMIISLIPLLAVVGCTSEDPSQQLMTLLGDLARQLLTFWIL